MAKKQNKESPEDQAKRFEKAIQDMIDAGELNPTEADKRMESFVSGNLRNVPDDDQS